MKRKTLPIYNALRTTGTDIFVQYWQLLGDDQFMPTLEYRFAPPRLWRFDLAFVHWRVGVEIEGGVWVHGRHVRGQGYESDLEKYNAAVELGWRLLRYTPNLLNRQPDVCVQQVLKVLKSVPQGRQD